MCYFPPLTLHGARDNGGSITVHKFRSALKQSTLISYHLERDSFPDALRKMMIFVQAFQVQRRGRKTWHSCTVMGLQPGPLTLWVRESPTADLSESTNTQRDGAVWSGEPGNRARSRALSWQWPKVSDSECDSYR